MPGARKVTGVTSVPSWSRVVEAARAPSVTHGSGIGSHARPTCGIWMRWSMSAMPASPASSAAPPCRAAMRAGPPRPGSATAGARHRAGPTGRRVGRPRGGLPSGPAPAIRASARPEPPGRPATPPASSRSRRGGDGGELAREDAGRDRALASGVARTAYGRRRVEDDGDGRKPCSPGRGQPAAAAGHVGAERVDDSGQAAPDAGRDDLLEKGERVDRGVEVVLTAADDRAQQVRGDDLGGAVARRRPGRLARARRADQHDEGRVGQGHCGGVPARRLSASGGGRARRARPTPCARWAPR